MDYTQNTELLIRYLAQECTESEKQQVQDWLRSDPRNQQEFDRLKHVWEQSAEDFSRALPDSQALWKRLQSTIRKEQPFRAVHTGSQPSLLQWVGRIAASVLLVLGLCLSIYYWQQTGTLTQVTQRQQKKKVTLPDGTHVWLNASSQLSYPKQFGANERKVRLEGEAFFEVVHLGPNQPFIILAGETETTVLGTSFNVKAYPKREVQVIVVTGKVAMASSREPARRILVTKGFTGRFDPASEKLKREVTKDVNQIAWKTGVLTFNKTSLNQVVDDISRHYHRNVRLTNAALGKCRFTAHFDHQPFEQVIRTLSLTFNAQISYQDQLILLQGGECQ